MNSKHKKTLAAINSLAKSIQFRDVESLLRAVECKRVEGDGSRITFAKDGKRFHVHRPHPGNTLLLYQVKELRSFLNDIGVK